MLKELNWHTDYINRLEWLNLKLQTADQVKRHAFIQTDEAQLFRINSLWSATKYSIFKYDSGPKKYSMTEDLYIVPNFHKSRCILWTARTFRQMLWF